MSQKYTAWDFVVSQHGYHYENISTHNCSITLETLATVTQETQVARELSILLRENVIPHFGDSVHMIHSIVFHWENKIWKGQEFLATQVTITYTTRIAPITADEYDSILTVYNSQPNL